MPVALSAPYEPPPPFVIEGLSLPVLECLQDGLTVLDAKTGRLVYANTAAAHLVGFRSAKELVATTAAEVVLRYELLDESGRPTGPESLPTRQALQRGEPCERRVRFRVRESGDERISSVRAVPLKDAQGAITHVATFFRDVTHAHRSERALKLLSTTGALLASSLELDNTLKAVAQAAVPELADWCALELVDDRGHGRQVAVAHVDPAKVSLAQDLRARFPPDPNALHGVPHVLRTGQREYVPEISEELLRQAARSEEEYRIAKELGLRSYIVVPLVARERILGALTLVQAESGRLFREPDVELAQELANRAALAVDNAQLYAEAKAIGDRLGVALAAGRLGAWEWDIRAGKVNWSPTLEQIHGLPVGSFDGSFEMYQADMHPEDKPRVLEHIQRLLATREKRHHVSYRIIRPDGAVRWLEASGEVTFGDDGAPLRLNGVCTDVTERREAEANAQRLVAERSAREAAERAEVRTRSILESIGDPFFVVGEDGKVRYANGPSVAVFGGGRTTLEGEDAWGLLGEANVAQLHDELGKAQSDGQPRSFELGQGERSYEVFLHPGPLGLSVYCRDITLRRQAESELALQSQELRRSNSELEQFAYVASHDLQEPLRMVASYTQLLARRYKGKLDGDADEFIQYAVDGVTRMQGLIHDLLSYSRVGTRMRELAPVESSRVVKTALQNLDVTLKEAKATVTVTPPELPAVKGDEAQLVQLFQNLVSNAVKFRGSESPRITLSAERKGEQFEFTIRDNGIGIDPQYFDRVFVIFQRLHLRTEYPGNGIGLAICKKIVERHGGRIWLTSEPGSGTTVHFTLAALEAAATEQA